MSIGAHCAYGVHGVHMVPVVSMVLMESCITFTLRVVCCSTISVMASWREVKDLPSLKVSQGGCVSLRLHSVVGNFCLQIFIIFCSSDGERPPCYKDIWTVGKNGHAGGNLIGIPVNGIFLTHEDLRGMMCKCMVSYLNSG